MFFLVDGDSLTCPKDTEYCFLKTANPATYDEKMTELCRDPTCETCLDICRDRKQCLGRVQHIGVHLSTVHTVGVTVV